MVQLYAQENPYYYKHDKKKYLRADFNRVVVKFKNQPATEHAQVLAQSFSNISPASARPVGKSLFEFTSKGQELNASDISSMRMNTDVFAVHPVFITQDENAELYFTNEICVQFNSAPLQAEVDELLKRYKLSIERSSNAEPYYLLKTDSPSDILEIANAVAKEKNILFSHPNIYTNTLHRLYTPNDRYFSRQFNLYNYGQGTRRGTSTSSADIKMIQAWDFSTGSSLIKVSVLDDGLDLNHEDISSSKIIAGYDFADHDSNVQPIGTNAHGTNCVGLIAADHNTIGIAGISPNSKIQMMKIFRDDGYGGSSDDLVKAIDSAWSQGADVLSNSWAYGTSDTNYIPAIRQAVIRARTQGRNGKGCVVVFAAGNSANRQSGYNGIVLFPANISQVLTVAASDRNDQVSYYSPNCNPSGNVFVEMSAPSHRAYTEQISSEGFEVWSTDISGSLGYNAGTQDTMAGDASGHYDGNFGGTSAACPQVAGAAALILSIVPTLTATEVENILLSTTDKVGGYNYDAIDSRPGSSVELGYGRLNVYKSLLQVSNLTFQFINKIEATQNYGSLVVDNDKVNPVSSGGTRTFAYNTNHTVRTNELPFIINWNSTGKTEKQHHFYSSNLDYSLNHSFTARPDYPQLQDANFVETKPVTINNPMLDGGTGGTASILFKDPWRYYQDGNNDWFQSDQFISYSTPFAIQNNSTNSYGGVFLYQPIESGKPSYSVYAPATQTINGITSYFLNWSSNNAVIENPNTQETGVVFTEPNATVTANYKGHRYSTSSNATLGNGQRKVVRAIDGNGHYAMVYESMNRIWLTTSSDGSSWSNEIEISSAESNRIHKYPTLTVSGNIIAVVWQSESDDNYDFVIHLRRYNISTGALSSTTDDVFWYWTGSPLGTIDAKPVIAANWFNYDGSGDDIMMAWRVPGEGIYVNTRNTSYGYGWATPEIAPNTNGNCVTPSITNVYWYGNYNYHLCWKNNTTGQIAYTELDYDYQADDIQFYNATTLAPTGWSENYFPSIIFSPDNKVTVAWQSYDEVAEGISVVVRQKSSGTWGDITSFSTGATYQAEPVLGTYRYGSTYNKTELVWSYGNTVYASTHNGSTWSNPEIVASGANGGSTAAIIPHSYSTANPNSILKVFRNSSNIINTLIWGGLQKADMADAKSVNFRLNKHALQTLEANSALSEKGYKGLIAFEIAGLSHQTAQSSIDVDVMFDEGQMRSSSFVVGANTDALKLAAAYYAKGLHIPEGAKLTEINDLVSVTLKDAKTKELVKDLWKVPFSRLSLATTTDGEFRTQSIPLNGLKGKEVFLEVSMHGSAQPLFVEDYYIISSEETNLKKFFAETPQLPTEYSLHQNYPNPFNPSTTIRFDLVEPQNVTMKVYNSLGQEVMNLVNEYYNAGSHEVTLNASSLSSGAYFYRMTAGKYSSIKSLMLVK